VIVNVKITVFFPEITLFLPDITGMQNWGLIRFDFVMYRTLCAVYTEPFLYITYFSSLQATVIPTDKDQVK
jgi:hypothetical protein